MPENKESCDGIYCGVAPPSTDKNYTKFCQDARAKGVGAFYFTHDLKCICAILPPHPDYFSRWAIKPHKLHNGASWTWDRNKENPTLKPSLHWVGSWHGHLTAGKFVSCK